MNEEAGINARRPASSLLGDHLSDHLAVDVGEPEVAPRVAIGQPLVVEAELVQDSGVQVVHVHSTLNGELAEVIGHAMGAAGALELAGNLPAFEDGYCHPTINVDDLDPDCELKTLVVGEPRRLKRVEYILNNSFGMLGINSVVIIKRFSVN